MREIIWTKTDEAPLLASYSLLPILRLFLRSADIDLKIADISLAGRILAKFNLANDDLKALGELAQSPFANIIKLPNISATIPQLTAAIAELRAKGYDLPEFTQTPASDEQKKIAEKYASVLGSAVNPVLREGNSDRRVAPAVKAYARANPHDNGKWSKDVKTRVAHMDGGDFYENERSVTADADDVFSVKFCSKSGCAKLKEINVQKGEIIDATILSAGKLREFYAETFEAARREDLLISLHLKATMMKVSDPEIFASALEVYFAEIFSDYGGALDSCGAKAKNGLKDMFEKISTLTSPVRDEILAKFGEILARKAQIAMVDSERGISNFHVPNDVIIDASMPALLRNSGRMKDKNGRLKETLAIIPDRTYATLYEAAIKNLKERGAIDAASAGSVANVGLMAKKAEEYGSHDKTFIAGEDGDFKVFNAEKEEIFKFRAQKGDIFRMTQTKDDAVQSWLDLALERAKITGEPLIFWLDENRAHDREILAKFKARENEFIAAGAEFEILDYANACEKTLNLIREGKNVISVTGNVLRDYLTDLFPILELASSAKMLSIVPLLNGGGLYETGAGGTAPMLAREFIEKNHLSWDSLGEYLALGASLEKFALKNNDKNAKILASALDEAIGEYLMRKRSPSPKIGEPDARTSHYYLALYWARALGGSKSENESLGAKFEQIARELERNEERILSELNAKQGEAAALGGYFSLNDEAATRAMRPSPTLNKIIG